MSALLRLEECEPTTTHLAVVADLTRMAAHEFNNILNNITLQLAVMEQTGLPAELRPDLAVIRQAARTAAAMINQLQQFSQHRQGPGEAVDLTPWCIVWPPAIAVRSPWPCTWPRPCRACKPSNAI